MEFQSFQSDPQAALMGLALDLIVTVLLYGAGPVLFVKIRKSPVTLRFFRNFCVLYTIFIYLLFSALYLLSGISGVPNMAASVIWGVVFYRVCRKKLRKKEADCKPEAALEAPGQRAESAAQEPRQIVEVYRSKFRMPGQTQGSVRKMGRRIRLAAVGLCAALVASVGVNVYLSYQLQDRSAALRQAESEASSYSQRADSMRERYLEEKARADEAQEKANFLSSRIGMIVEGSPYYHSYSCEVFQNADAFWAHNVEYCRSLGYTKCPQCGWSLD